jgi:hypothetical protein
VKALDFKHFEGNTLRGFLDIMLPATGLKIFGCSFLSHQTGGRLRRVTHSGCGHWGEAVNCAGGSDFSRVPKSRWLLANPIGSETPDVRPALPRYK